MYTENSKKSSIPEKPDHLQQKTNQVIIRIWHSAFNKMGKGENVGHVSIEIPSYKVKNSSIKTKDETVTDDKVSFYASFWPGGSSSGGFKKFFETRDPHYMASFDDDRESETGPTRPNGDPETTICLYSLNIRNIVNKFERLKKEIKGWTLFGSNKFIKKSGQESCASLAYKLLKAGGIYGLTHLGYDRKFLLASAPDNLAKLVMSAKRKELDEYKETQNFVHKGETEITMLDKKIVIEDKKAVIQDKKSICVLQ